MGLDIVDLDGKPRFLQDIARRAFANLHFEPDSHVVAMPDLHPMRDFADTPFAHESYEALVDLLTRLVHIHTESEGSDPSEVGGLLQRFHAFPLSYDLEMLLLAAHETLGSYLRASGSLANAFRHPAEDQDDNTPPKQIVRQLFARHHHKKTKYKPTLHAPAVLRNVSPGELRDSGECPRFAQFLGVLERISGVPLP